MISFVMYLQSTKDESNEQLEFPLCSYLKLDDLYNVRNT